MTAPTIREIAERVLRGCGGPYPRTFTEHDERIEISLNSADIDRIAHYALAAEKVVEAARVFNKPSTLIAVPGKRNQWGAARAQARIDMLQALSHPDLRDGGEE
jgi:hypothetical protein